MLDYFVIKRMPIISGGETVLITINKKQTGNIRVYLCIFERPMPDINVSPLSVYRKP